MDRFFSEKSRGFYNFPVKTTTGLRKIPLGLGRGLALQGKRTRAFRVPVSGKSKNEGGGAKKRGGGVKNWDEKGKKKRLPLQGKKCPRYISATPGKGEGALDFLLFLD